MMRACLISLGLLAAACGPSVRGDDGDPNAPCNPGAVEDCYDGQPGTEGVGPCHPGSRTCTDQGLWTQCEGQVVPLAESCTDAVDNNCNGMVDEDVDADGDGFTTCGGDCCDSTECGSPNLVNPGAFDAPGNGVDDDCNGVLDDTVAACDQGLPTNSTAGLDFAKAIELCQIATMQDRRWGVMSAQMTLADGTGQAAPVSHSIRPKWGTATMPKAGSSLVLLSTGHAASKGDQNPAWQDFENGGGLGNGNGTQSPFPADFLQANGGRLPNAPGCPDPAGNIANDPVMFTLEIRVPTNAKSFKLMTNFFSSEFPEYTCSPYNDFFVVLLDSTYTGSPANPTDKNLAFYSQPSTMMKFPVGVNLANGNTGLFTQCVNGATGCSGNPGSINTCVATDQLQGTGLETPESGNCDANSLQGGGTGWLETSGNVVGGEIIKLRIAIWDTSDHILDSIAIIDAFQWSVDASQPGTVIF